MEDRATLIYDGNCPLCRRAMDWVEKRARPNALEYLTCQSAERAERFPDMPEVECMEAIQLVMPDGAVYAADKAMPHLFTYLKGWRWLAVLLRTPGLSLFSGPTYRFVAGHRYYFSLLVARKEREEECPGPEACDAPKNADASDA